MNSKTPRPPTPFDRVGRSGFEGFRDAFDPRNSITQARQQGDISALPWPLNAVQAPGNATERLARMMEAAKAHALKLEGLRAFECPKSSAAIHEAGHAVFYAQSGILASKVAIWPILVSGKQCWLGKTYGVGKSRFDATTSASAI